MDLSKSGERIKEMRNKKGLTQTQLASMLDGGETDRGKSKISEYEHGKNLTLKNLQELANVLECDVDYLLGCIDHPEITTAWIAEQIPLSRDAIESLKHLGYAFKEWSDFDSALASSIISSLIVYIVKSLDANIFEHKGFMMDAADLLMAFEKLAQSDSTDPVSYASDLYAKLAIRGIMAKMGNDLAEIVRDSVKEFVEV